MAHRDFDTDWDSDIVLETGQGEPADWHRSHFFPGERIGAQSPGRTRSVARQILSAAVIIAAGWAALETHATWRPWLAVSLIKIRAEVVRAQQSPQPHIATALPTTVAPLGAAKEVADVTGTTSPPPQAAPAPIASAPAASIPPPSPAPAPSETNITTSSITPEATSPTATAAPLAEPLAPLPKPDVDPTDPLQKRAADVGLPQRISTVVLASLTDTDYRNAGTAIRKALTDATDTDKFIWPREADKKLGVFQVHFVAGAAATCRRYIVTIVKNGWTTTAPPMEKCGVATAAHRITSDPPSAKPQR